ncbi:MAG TPA: zinc ribbon domain-containing protein, partial [Rhodocyclaceae bacterium]|nr:zinc ribbon domain-containing protein [Rhodocyclaceae bacterium]
MWSINAGPAPSYSRPVASYNARHGLRRACLTERSMPIYAYRCSACGHEKDVLQKMSDAPLTLCPACNTEHFSKQIT